MWDCIAYNGFVRPMALLRILLSFQTQSGLSLGKFEESVNVVIASNEITTITRVLTERNPVLAEWVYKEKLRDSKV